MSKVLGVTRVNFRYTRLALLIGLIAVGAQCISDLINILVALNSGGTMNASIGWYGLLYPLLAAIFIPSLNYRRFMNLNVKKANFLKGTAINYLLLALGATAFNTLWYFLVDKSLERAGLAEFWNMIGVFGWADGSLPVLLLRQFSFALMVLCLAHMLTGMQVFWYGWVVDAVLIAILSVFIPIAPLRAALLWFFHQIIFNPSAPLQIVYCLVLAAAFYAISVATTRHRQV